MSNDNHISLKEYLESAIDSSHVSLQTDMVERVRALEEELHPERKTHRLERELAQAQDMMEKYRREAVEAQTQRVLAEERLGAAMALLTELAGDSTTIFEAVETVIAKGQRKRDRYAQAMNPGVKWDTAIADQIQAQIVQRATKNYMSKITSV